MRNTKSMKHVVSYCGLERMELYRLAAGIVCASDIYKYFSVISGEKSTSVGDLLCNIRKLPDPREMLPFFSSSYSISFQKILFR